MSTRTNEAFARLTGEVPDVVYHYCGPDALLGILKSRQIWATSARHLNDTSERIFAADLMRCVAKRLTLKVAIGSRSFEETPAALLIRRAEEAISYLACFSERADLLSQWRAYTPSTGGYSIGIHTSSLTSVPDVLFGRCEYNHSSQEEAIERILRDHLTILDSDCSLEQRIEADDPELQSFIAALLTLIPLLKHPGFSEEAEWRLVRGPFEAEVHTTEFRSSRGSLVPFQKIDLVAQNDRPPFAELLIGPSPDARDRREATRRLLDQHGLQSCDLRISDIPYRGW